MKKYLKDFLKIKRLAMRSLYSLMFIMIAFDIHYLGNAVPAYAPLLMGVFIALEILMDYASVIVNRKLDELESKIGRWYK